MQSFLQDAQDRVLGVKDQTQLDEEFSYGYTRKEGTNKHIGGV